MGLFGEGFEAFAASDFDAFLASKRSSRRFNLERGRVRARALALLDAALEQLASQGSAWPGFEPWSSLDHPSIFNGQSVICQTVALCRDAATRDALQRADATLDADRLQDSHLHVGLRLDDAGVVFFVALPAGAHFDRSSAPLALDVLRALPPLLGAWFAGDEPVETLDAAGLGRGGPALRFVHSVSCETAIAWADTAVGHFADWLVAVQPAVLAASWSPLRDPEDLAATIERAAVEVAPGPTRPVVVVQVAKFAEPSAPTEPPARPAPSQPSVPDR